MSAEAWTDKGAILLSARDAPAARHAFERALEAAPTHATAWTNLGAALQHMGRSTEALAHLRRAQELAPASLDVQLNLALALRENGRRDESTALLERLHKAFALDPEVRFALAFNRLLGGDFARGWADMEARSAARQRDGWVYGRVLAAPRWNGAPAPKKTLLLCGEQGAGDMIQFMRFVPQALERVARVVLELPEDLLALPLPHERLQLVPRGAALPRHDLWVPLMSLPGLLGLGPGPLGDVFP